MKLGSGTQPCSLDVSSLNNYEPFGMQMPGMTMTAGSYRYGYNGMEKDDELKGKGNSLNTEFRLFDPRSVRWLALDPVIHEWESPYAGFGNNPINKIDPNGDINLDVIFDSFEIQWQCGLGVNFSVNNVGIGAKVLNYNITTGDLSMGLNVNILKGLNVNYTETITPVSTKIQSYPPIFESSNKKIDEFYINFLGIEGGAKYTETRKNNYMNINSKVEQTNDLSLKAESKLSIDFLLVGGISAKIDTDKLIKGLTSESKPSPKFEFNVNLMGTEEIGNGIYLSPTSRSMR